MSRIVTKHYFQYKRALTSELFVDGSLLKVLFTVDETASSMSPTNESSFNAVSGNYNKTMVGMKYLQIKMSKRSACVRHNTIAI